MKRLLILLVMLFAPAGAFSGPSPEPPSETTREKAVSSPKTSGKLSREDTIERLAQGLIDFKKYPGTDTSNWYSCGEFVPLEKQKEEARRWAATAYDILAKENAKHNTNIPVWGVFATILNESAGDECAVDFITRKIMYGLKILKPKRNHITHSKEELKAAFSSWKWKKWAVNASKYENKRVGVDIGAMQLRRHWRKITPKFIDNKLDLKTSLETAIPEMVRRSLHYPVKGKGYHPRPWMLWPGKHPNSARAKKYDRRITRLAVKKLNAPSGVI